MCHWPKPRETVREGQGTPRGWRRQRAGGHGVRSYYLLSRQITRVRTGGVSCAFHLALGDRPSSAALRPLPSAPRPGARRRLQHTQQNARGRVPAPRLGWAAVGWSPPPLREPERGGGGAASGRDGGARGAESVGGWEPLGSAPERSDLPRTLASAANSRCPAGEWGCCR